MNWTRIDRDNYQTTDTDECVRITADRTREKTRGKFGRGALRYVERVRWNIYINGDWQEWELTLKAAKHRAKWKLVEYRASREAKSVRSAATTGAATEAAPA